MVTDPDRRHDGADFANVYTKVTKRNQDGAPIKSRIVHEPNDAMRELHRETIEWLRRVAPRMSYAVGGEPGISPRDALLRHGNNRYGYMFDLHAAFDSVAVTELAWLLWELIESPEDAVSYFGLFKIETSLAQHFLHRQGEGLATGAPASPVLFNFYAHQRLDRLLGPWCKERGLVMTRFIDDILITAPEPIGRRKRREIRGMVQLAKFTRAQGQPRQKEFVFDLAQRPVTVLGIQMRRGGNGLVRLALPPKVMKQLRSELELGIAHPFADVERHDWVASRVGMLKGVLPPAYRKWPLPHAEPGTGTLSAEVRYLQPTAGQRRVLVLWQRYRVRRKEWRASLPSELRPER